VKRFSQIAPPDSDDIADIPLDQRPVQSVFFPEPLTLLRARPLTEGRYGWVTRQDLGKGKRQKQNSEKCCQEQQDPMSYDSQVHG